LRSPKNLRQFATLPYRTIDGRLQVLLVTTLGNGRWMVPKGWPIKAHHPFTAAREGFEEAGVHGACDRAPFGRFQYTKRIKRRRLPMEAVVFPMRVKGQLASWPEQGLRQVRWFSINDAVTVVREPSLKSLLAAFGRRQRAIRLSTP